MLIMSNYNKHKLFIFLSSVSYLFCLTIGIIKDLSIISLVPLLLLFIYTSVVNYKFIFYLVVFLTPLSMSLRDLGYSFDIEMAFPTEPILFGLMILSLFKIIHNFKLFKPLLKTSFVFFLLLYIFWLFITSITSSMPLVSFKFLISRLWYILPFFIIGSLFFQDQKNILQFIKSYTLPFTAVILYTIARHSKYFFDKESAHFVMSPFFNDHTSYGAMIAFFIPLAIAMLMLSKKKLLVRLLWLLIIIILLSGLILSYTRAAWISLFIAFICVAVLRLRIKKGIIFLCLGLLLCFGLFFQGNIFQLLEGNRQDSSDNLLEHVSSLSNISTDASNMERINRWKCALEMFIEKPIFGWGPGTYQFQYAPFQLYNDKTIISSNRGDMGNAHSEYLSVLAESGLIGLFLFVSLIIIVLYKAINMYYLNINLEYNILMLSFICALLTYFIHGLFNNFLDTDKASVAIWAIISMIISLDISIPKKQRL